MTEGNLSKVRAHKSAPNAIPLKTETRQSVVSATPIRRATWFSYIVKRQKFTQSLNVILVLEDPEL